MPHKAPQNFVHAIGAVKSKDVDFMQESNVILQLRNVTKKFGDFVAIRDVDLDIYDGEFLTIVGPSGSGKTTMIRLLVGMDKPTEGDIHLKNIRINDVPANKRPTCMVFQSLALFPHRTVGQNIEFPLKIRGADSNSRKDRAMDLIRLLQLPENYYSKNVMKCSGGERQRVALARALAFDPEILFFDEPLSSIDFRLRKTLEKELKDIHRRTGKTFVYITHSLEEAMVMSDRIAVLRQGEFVQIGSPDDIYNQPKNQFVSEFMGEVNVFPVEVREDGSLHCSEVDAVFACPLPHQVPGSRGSLVVRPEAIRFLEPGEQCSSSLEGAVFNEYSLGSRMQYNVQVADKMITIEKLREQRYGGDFDRSVSIGWDIEDSVLLDITD